MKYYTYYIGKVDQDKMSSNMLYNFVNDTDDWILYAYTNNKKLAKKFEAQRDMSKFVKKIIYMDEMSKKYSDRVLSEKPITYKNSNYEMDCIIWVITDYEQSAISVDLRDTVAHELLNIEYNGKFELFKDEIIDLLANKLHICFYNISRYGFSEDFEYKLDEYADDALNDNIDELEVFIKAFGYTLKGD